jgi:hypothetical protein
VHDLSLYLLELLENSVRAEAKHVVVNFFVDRASDMLCITVEDDGRGLSNSPDEVLDPFYTTKSNKKTGLGLSLLRAEAEAAGGSLTLSTRPGAGACVRVEMQLSHVDRPPFGDMVETLTVTAFTNPDVAFTVDLQGDEFREAVSGGTVDQVRSQLKDAAEELERMAADQGKG